MTLAATSGDPADTHIVGAPDPNSALDGKDYEGRGPNAVRCIRLEKAAASGGAVIRGFTIRDGYSAQRYNGDAYGASDALLAAQPGGVTAFSADYANFYVTDCVITNCYGVRGGLVRYGRYVRCRFADGHGSAGASLGRNIKVLSSLILKMPGACADNSTFVNCTFADGNGAARRLHARGRPRAEYGERHIRRQPGWRRRVHGRRRLRDGDEVEVRRGRDGRRLRLRLHELRGRTRRRGLRYAARQQQGR